MSASSDNNAASSNSGDMVITIKRGSINMGHNPTISVKNSTLTCNLSDFEDGFEVLYGENKWYYEDILVRLVEGTMQDREGNAEIPDRNKSRNGQWTLVPRAPTDNEDDEDDDGDRTNQDDTILTVSAETWDEDIAKMFNWEKIVKRIRMEVFGVVAVEAESGSTTYSGSSPLFERLQKASEDRIALLKSIAAIKGHAGSEDALVSFEREQKEAMALEKHQQGLFMAANQSNLRINNLKEHVKSLAP